MKHGNLIAATYVLDHLGIKNNSQWSGSYANGNPIWGEATRQATQVEVKQVKTPRNIVPDVRGMGARDAVYLLESRGIKTAIHGCGKVSEQSVAPGSTVKLGQLCVLTMK